METLLKCSKCGGNFTLTEEGKRVFSEQQFKMPDTCRECGRIDAYHHGRDTKPSPYVTNSDAWTPEGLQRYGLDVRGKEASVEPVKVVEGHGRAR